MKKQLKRLTASALALVMALALIPVTTKPVEAAAYPAASQILIEGKSLASGAPKGISYDAKTGILKAEWNHPDYTYGFMQVTGGDNLTIETVGQYGGGFAGLYAPNCNLTFRGNGYLLFNTDPGTESYDYGIEAKTVTIQDKMLLEFYISSDSAARKLYGIKTSGNLTIKDHANVYMHMNSYASHDSDHALYGLYSDKTLTISSDTGQSFFTYDKPSEDKRYAVKAANYAFSNCPMISATGDIEVAEDWNNPPAHYVYGYQMNDGHGYSYEFWRLQHISLSGSNRYATAVAVAKEAYPNGPSTKEIVIVTGEKFPDALAANAYAGTVGAPVLMSRLDHLDKGNIYYLTPLFYSWTIEKVTVIGNEWKDSFWDDLNELGFSKSKGNINHIFGSNRYQTADAIFEATLASAGENNVTAVAIATGENPYDAMSFSPWAYAYHIPILLVKDGMPRTGLDSSGLPYKTEDHIAKFKNKTIYLLGGENAVSASSTPAGCKNCLRLAGTNRKFTSQKIAEYFVDHDYGGYNYTTFADATRVEGEKDGKGHWPDALAAGTLAGVKGAPIILMEENNKEEAHIHTWINKIYGLTCRSSEGYTNEYYYIGWAGYGKSSEYQKLVNWIEAKG